MSFYYQLCDKYIYIANSKVYRHRELYRIMSYTDLLRKEVSMNEKQLRETAIRRYENGEYPILKTSMNLSKIEL